jgi:hypothetical protein
MDISGKTSSINLELLDIAYQDSETLNDRLESTLQLVKEQFDKEKEEIISNIKTCQINLGIRKSLNCHIEISDRITYASKVGSNTLIVYRDQNITFDEFVFNFFDGALASTDLEVIIWKGYCYPLSSGPKLVELEIISKESYKTLIMNKITSK